MLGRRFRLYIRKLTTGTSALIDATVNSSNRIKAIENSPHLHDILLSSTPPTNNDNALKLRFCIETYGCQMNVSDSDIVRSILISHGHVPCTDIDSADLILTNTCAIRENAEAKVWHRLRYFQSLREKNRADYRKQVKGYFSLNI